MQNHGLWDEQATWYQKELLNTLEEIRSAGAIIEVNTRGLYKKLTQETYPSLWVLQQILDLEIPIHINSDAHTPDEISNEFADTYELVYSLGFRRVKILVNGNWESVAINAQGLKANFST
jgi:histidinol-phosphatase (PHP family)